jgi:hypothetical protein
MGTEANSRHDTDGLGEGIHGLNLFFHDRIAQHADAVDLDLHHIACLEIHRRLAAHPDAFRRSGEDHGAGLEGRAAAEKFDQLGDREDHVAGIALLHGDAVDARSDGEIIRILDRGGCDQRRAHGTKRVEGLSPAPLRSAPLFLPIARAHVVGDGVAEHIIHRIGAGDILAFVADDHGQFALEIDLVAAQMARKHDWTIRILDRRGAFQENDRLLGDFCAGFLGMLAVIQADAIDRPRLDRGKDRKNIDPLVRDLELPARHVATQGKKAFAVIRGRHAGLMAAVPQTINFHPAR